MTPRNLLSLTYLLFFGTIMVACASTSRLNQKTNPNLLSEEKYEVTEHCYRYTIDHIQKCESTTNKCLVYLKSETDRPAVFGEVRQASVGSKVIMCYVFKSRNGVQVQFYEKRD